MENILYKRGATSVLIADFLSIKNWFHFPRIIANPPFDLAEDFIRHSYAHLANNGRMAFYLRLSMLSGIKRFRFLSEYKPTSVHITAQRPTFNNRPDICGYAWVIWDRPFTDYPTELHWSSPKGG